MTFESIRTSNHSTVIAIRLARSAFATFRRQKIDSDDEEKFDCGQRAHRFDLIRWSRPMLLLRALPLRA
jgi:hypothetical protein